MERKQRLIDADDAEKFAREHILDAKERFLILDFLRGCSTVDAVEVVRCKDCKSWTQYIACNGSKPHRCMNYNAIFYKRTEPDYFCSYGERKKTDGK